MDKQLTLLTQDGQPLQLVAGAVEARPYTPRAGDMWTLADGRLILVEEVDEASGIVHATRVANIGLGGAPGFYPIDVLDVAELAGATWHGYAGDDYDEAEQ